MPSFTLKRIEAASGSVEFFELVVDGERPFKLFRNEIQSNKLLMDQLERVFGIIAMLSDGEHLPGKMNHPLDNPILGGVEYEIKTNDLRVYYFKHEDGKIVVLPGFKKKQKQDILHFRNLKREFLNSL